jgi:hypothetical protein
MKRKTLFICTMLAFLLGLQICLAAGNVPPALFFVANEGQWAFASQKYSD